ncbi:Transposable element Tc3 transposase-like Protein [Tribolium castaneum]|uniref:Transposable element Tc3 transposase-like Protein n=1 Tax=Tribolium castaneum TaxID=7070 RepID=D7EIM7_TRICA|nr:Transposable element Tc3 transposase-like Protein [Tribolium castaneum]
MVLNSTDAARAIALVQDGRSHYYAARVLGVSRCRMQRAVERFRETGSYTRRVGSGRRRCTTARDDHFLTQVLRNRDTTAVNSRVLFSDEWRFCLHSPDGRHRIWRRSGERFAQCNIVPRVNFGGGSIMVWGGISLEARTELVIVDRGTMTADRYIRDI